MKSVSHFVVAHHTLGDLIEPEEDAPRRKPKHCKECGTIIKARSTFCLPCYSKHLERKTAEQGAKRRAKRAAKAASGGERQ